uniref:Threonylcarbamoyl-AMP synthase n=1 Tax=Spongospora subterranea TaxID=70186 RepID=A0A0H5RC16_9EUKA|eukprot:CRZ11147.1 hypothetical protein [Spongospora subterranea]
MRRMFAQASHVVTQRWGPADIELAAAAIKSGQVVGFPTETVYGAGANAFSDIAVKRIFDAKGRPSDNPLIVHAPDFESARKLVCMATDTIENDVGLLAKAFWPGPLTIILPSNSPISPLVTAGLDTVGIRVPDHPIAHALLVSCGVPIAAPSANLSGKPSPTSAVHVLSDLDGRIAGVLDGGSTGVGLESTVIDCTSEPYTVLRPGGVTLEQLQSVLSEGRVRSGQHEDDSMTPRAPGMKYQHYAPTAPLYYVKGNPDAVRIQIAKALDQGLRVGLLKPASKDDCLIRGVKLITCGSHDDLESIAQQLYSCLRRFDTEDSVDVIFANGFPCAGLGAAIMNRLLKASTHIIDEEVSRNI